MRRGLLLIDRGSRESEARDELEAICAGIREKGDYVFVDFCFLEVVPPYIKEGISKCLSNNIDSLTIVPYFLYPGRKVKNAVTDVMKFQQDTKTKFVVTKQMSMHKTMIKIVKNRITSALEGNGITLDDDKIDVMIVGHGSKDPNAQMSLDYVVNGLTESYRNVSRCWLEIEQPDIFEGVRRCKQDNPEVLVVVFYFLHEGAHVKTDINQDLVPALAKFDLKDALITKHIGADPAMIELILERAREVQDAD